MVLYVHGNHTDLMAWVGWRHTYTHVGTALLVLVHRFSLVSLFFFLSHGALRPQKPQGLLGTGAEWRDLSIIYNYMPLSLSQRPDITVPVDWA